jgi:hypothetical protein
MGRMLAFSTVIVMGLHLVRMMDMTMVKSLDRIWEMMMELCLVSASGHHLVRTKVPKRELLKGLRLVPHWGMQ